ncbi:short-chain dehydrogenase [Rhodotorula sp. JG-1b]|nr:short-chain dehydrogenase [Rhodotorula sp. JG-1b]
MSCAPFLVPRLFSVKGLVAVVTGGGTGIGLMATQALAANGAKVYIVGRRKEALDNVVKHYSDVEGKIIPLQGDVTKKDDLKRIVDQIKKEDEGIHILVNNAGIVGEVTQVGKEASGEELRDKFWEGQTYEGWENVFRTNVSSVFFTTAAFLPLLQRYTFGGDAAGKAIYDKYQTGVITISSISGLLKISQNHFAYNSSKGATIHLNRMMSQEWAHTGIRFNTIAPGMFPSEMTTTGSDDKQKSSLKGFNPKSMLIPAERAGEDEDLGGTVLYLSSRAGQYTSGVVLPVDGATLATNPSAY